MSTILPERDNSLIKDKIRSRLRAAPTLKEINDGRLEGTPIADDRRQCGSNEKHKIASTTAHAGLLMATTVIEAKECRFVSAALD